MFMESKTPKRTAPKRELPKRKYKDSIPPNIPQKEVPITTPPPMFNLTFKNESGVSIVSVPDVQIHQLAQAIHHFFRERNIQSTFNHKKTVPDGEQNKPPTTGS